MKLKSLCREIKPDEELNYHDQNIISSPNNSSAYLKVSPFTHCYPFDRAETFQQWNNIACKIFPYESKSSIQIDDPGSGLPTNALTYQVSYHEDNGTFKITATSQRVTFKQDYALRAIKKVMINVIKVVNEIIEQAWMHKKMLECFPEFSTIIVGQLKADIHNVTSDLKKLQDDIGQIKPGRSDESLTTQFSIIENEVEKLKLTVAKHIFEINTLRTKINKPKRKRPRG